VGGEAVEEVVEIFLGVTPGEWPGGEVVAVLEGFQPGLYVGEVVEVVGSNDFALHDREVDFALVEPGGVCRGVDQGRGGPRLAHAVDRCLPAVRRAIVDNGHDLLDQPGEGGKVLPLK
jgi:hypothetical protein